MNGDWVHFVEAAEFIEFISTNDGSAFLWTDSEEILAIANLYQINIKVITLRTKEDLDPVTSFIVPDPDIKEFAMLPPGIVPDMILLHSEDSHFNLISSKQSRLVRNIEEKHKNKDKLDDKDNHKCNDNELNELKQKYDKLQKTYLESLEEIKHLKNNKPTTKKRKIESTKETDEEYNEQETNTERSDEEILTTSKQSGFSRDGPQSQPIPKPKTKEQCEVCKLTFESRTNLETHMKKHTSDGDWRCNDCPHQTNSESNLKNHIKLTHHTSPQIKKNTEPSMDKTSSQCNFCDKTFTVSNDFITHRQSAHKTFKPCRNLQNCDYKESCIFNHSPLEEGKYLCFECGKKCDTFKELMHHRKNNHNMDKCLKFMRNNCPFNDASCWYKHETTFDPENLVEMKSPDKLKNVGGNKSSDTPVFCEAPANLAPPSNQPSQATWLKMTSMLTDLNQMMKKMKETIPLLSL